MKKKKIIKSLKRIKKFCKGRSCKGCPAYTEGLGVRPNCLLRKCVPLGWEIKNISKRFKKEE